LFSKDALVPRQPGKACAEEISGLLFSGIIGELFPELLIVLLPFGTESLGVVAI